MKMFMCNFVHTPFQCKLFSVHTTDKQTSNFTVNVFFNINSVTHKLYLFFLENVRPVCLPTTEDTRNAKINYCIVTGWGFTDSGKSIPFYFLFYYYSSLVNTSGTKKNESMIHTY